MSERAHPAELSVQLLGPVRAHLGDREVDLGPTRRRTLFAILAMSAGQVVSNDEIIDRLWDDALPGNPVGSIYTYVNGLRRALEPQRDPRSSVSRLQSDPPGYRLLADDVDAVRFVSHLKAGRALMATDLESAVTEFDSALGIWHDDPLAGATGLFAQAARLRLLEQRFGLVEDRAMALLTLGRHAMVVPGLRELVRDYPLREPPRSLLIQALYRDGRVEEALAVFDDMKTVLGEELGIEPGPFLYQLRDRVADEDPALLSGRPQLAPVGTSGVTTAPTQLPAAVHGFTGRTTELEWLRSLLSPATGQAPVVGVISGPAGVGKTALALRIAHELSEHFPDGQLFVNLRGFDPHEPPANPAQILAKLLADLGGVVLPESEPELAARLRSMLSGKRVLLLLDNAMGSEQIRSLLPGSSCLVIVTSRNRLDGLVARDGAHVLDLQPLRPQESNAFLLQLVDEKRTAGAEEELGRIADLCGHLPLALGIVAHRLSTRPTLQLSDVVSELSSESDRLNALASDDAGGDAIRPVFSWSYQTLKPEPARMFRRLGLHPSDEISVQAAAALNETDVLETRRLLETLASRHFIEWAGRGRYRIHDLLRLYTKELIREEETTDERASATRRLFDWYLHTADNANELHEPPRDDYRLRFEPPPADCRPLDFADEQAAADWSASEADGQVTIVRYAVELGYDEYVWKMVSVVWKHIQYGPRLDEWIELKELAVAAAGRLGDSYAQMWLATDLAYAYHYARRLGQANERFTSCLLYWRTVGAHQPGARRREAAALSGLAHILHANGDLERALDYCFTALEIAREEQDPDNEIWIQSNIGMIYRKLGRFTEAEAVLRQGLAVRKAHGWRELLIELYLLRNLGQVKQSLGRGEQAVVYLDQALSIARGMEDPLSEVRVLYTLRQVLHDLGKVDEEAACARLAEELVEKFGIAAAAVEAMADE